MQRNAKVCKTSIFARKMFVRSKTLHSIVCKDKISNQNKRHSHTHPKKKIIQKPSKLIQFGSSKAPQFCRLLGQGCALAALASATVQATGAETPSLSPRGGQRLIKREVTSATEDHPNQQKTYGYSKTPIWEAVQTLPASSKHSQGLVLGWPLDK